MRRSAAFWSVVLIVLGVLLLLESLGLLGSVDVWSLLWPVFLVGLGLWILLGVIMPRRAPAVEEIAIPLEGAGRARIRIQHGAGRLDIGPGAGPDQLLNGTFGGGVDYRARRDGDALDVRMRVPERAFPVFLGPWNWGSGAGFDWRCALNPEIPISLSLEAGAGETRMDLSDLRITDLRIETGASSTDVTLPAHADQTDVAVQAGAASVTLRVPEGVAARIRLSGGLAGLNVDRGRFPRAGNLFQSPDYETARNRVNIRAEAGVGAINIR